MSPSALSPSIADVTITPIAVVDPPLLNSVGVHQRFALRSILQVRTDDGLVGISEAYGDNPTLERLRLAAAELTGLSIWDLNGLSHRVAIALGEVAPDSPTELVGAPSVAKSIASTVSAFEVALYDLQGKATGLRVCDLLGGPVREAVPFSAYLFYKWAGHPGDDPDTFGEALDPDGIVAQAKALVDRYGFGSLKLKGGVFAPAEEIAAIRALREAFPDHPLRLDPNANWSPATSHRVAAELTGLLEYLEDPTDGLVDMAVVAAGTDIPLATNMCVTTFDDIPEAVRLGSVKIILSDHHFWGGFRASQKLAGVCETFGLGLSMHSNTHLGVSLAAMTHLAAAIPNLTYACDTHSVWQIEEVIRPGDIEIRDGAVRVPDGPGLGVHIDDDALGRLHEQYLSCGIRRRDDVTPMRVRHPEWTGARPRF
jgi:glucarate dehydratase